MQARGSSKSLFENTLRLLLSIAAPELTDIFTVDACGGMPYWKVRGSP